MRRRRVLRRVLGLLTILTLGSAGLSLVLLMLVPAVRGLWSAGDTAGATELKALEELPQRSVVYAADGSVLAVLHDDENRVVVPLERIPPSVVNAVLDVEDANFWRHGGVNLRATGRALLRNVESGGVAQGGSTITQQVVKNALLTPEQDIDRKIREAVLATRLEDQVTKEEILERYLNSVYFGSGVYGVQAAAEVFFRTDVEKLTPGQGAFLAGVISNAVLYDPVRNPEGTTNRRNIALDRMLSEGHITTGQAEAYKLEPLPKPVPVEQRRPAETHFVEQVKRTLLADKRLGETPGERLNAVFKGGLKIQTTLDPRMQAAAEARAAEELPPNARQNGRFTSVVVSVEPATGSVRALVGGAGFDQYKFNAATQPPGQQAGSSFKTFVLAAAVESGINPESVLSGLEPCSIDLGPGQNPRFYSPGNYEGSKGGVATVTEATARSWNCAYLRLGLVVGFDKVAAMAKRMGITTPLHTGKEGNFPPSMVLGAKEVLPADMASAYATLANDGVHVKPHYVNKVYDRRGQLVFETKYEAERVMSEQTARLVNRSLQSVVTSGTGTRAALPGRQVAGKTGTSQEYRDAWFVGHTPQLATAVWVGALAGDVNNEMKNVAGINVTGGSFPSQIWSAYMKDALAPFPPAPFPAPDPAKGPLVRAVEDPITADCQVKGREFPSRTRGRGDDVCKGSASFDAAAIFGQDRDERRSNRRTSTTLRQNRSGLLPGPGPEATTTSAPDGPMSAGRGSTTTTGGVTSRSGRTTSTTGATDAANGAEDDEA